MKISIKKSCITPVVPSYLSGQINRIEKHTSVLDDLFCYVLVMEHNGNKICMLQYDLLQFDDYLSNRIRNRVKDELNISFESVFTIPSHTHAAPEVLRDGLFGIKTESSVAEGYLDFLVDVSVKTALVANDTLIESDLSYSEYAIDGYYGNRNNKNNPADKKIRFVQFKANNNTLGMLVNLSCHPTVLGQTNTQISADLFGYIRKGLEERYNCPVFMSNGAEGDISNRHYRLSDDVNELIRTGKGILEQIPSTLVFNDFKSVNLKIYTKQFNFHCFNDTKRLEEAIQRNNKLILQSSDKDQLKILNATNTVLYHQIKKNIDDILSISYSIIQLGDVFIVTVPMELFSSLYLKIDQTNPVLLFGLTNTSVGYCADELSYDSTYEGLTSPFIKGEGERFIQEINKELSQIRRRLESI